MTENSRFTFEYELGQAEQVRASRVMAHRQLGTRLFYAFLLSCVLAAVGLHLYARVQGRVAWPLGIPLTMAIALAGLATAYFSPFLSVRNLRKNNRAADGPHVYSFNDTGLDITSPGIRALIEWQNVAEVYESREFLLLYVSKAQAAVLPKRVVPDLQGLRDALRLWAGEHAHLREVGGGI